MPSVDQKIPNVVSITPTASLIVFSGTRASGARASAPTPATTTSAATAASAATPTLPCGRAERDHDERDLEPFEEHALEREGEAVRVDAAPALRAGVARGRELAGEDRGLVVEGFVAAGAEDRLPQPLEAEDQEQAADHHAQACRAGSG